MSDKDKYTREEDRRFTLRINKDLFKKLEESARKHKRAIGREIEYILEMELTDKTFVTKEDAINSFKSSLELFDDMPDAEKEKLKEIVEHPEKFDFSSIVARPDL